MGARGPKPWKPTAAERAKIAVYAGLGATQETIGFMLGKSVDSLDRYCREDLDRGKAEANLKVAGSLYKQAMAGNVSAAIFWAKTQMGWKETPQAHELSGPNGQPIRHVHAHDLSDEMLAAIAAGGRK